MDVLDIELSEAATKVVGRDTEIVWIDSDKYEGRAVTLPHGYRVELRNALKGDGVRMMATALHELAHLHLGHNMTPEGLRKSKYAKTPSAQLRATDTGTSTHLQREVEAWAQAGTWAAQLGRYDVVEHCKRRGDADVMAWVQIELGKLNKRLERLENGK